MATILRILNMDHLKFQLNQNQAKNGQEWKAYDSIPHSWVGKSIELVEVNTKIIRLYELLLKKWNDASVKNKAGRNAIAAHSDTNRNIPGALTLLFCVVVTRLILAEGGSQVHGTVGEVSHCIWMA
jgi:hypothetical protein